MNFFDWQEPALIRAFLIGNLSLRIAFCLSQLTKNGLRIRQRYFQNIDGYACLLDSNPSYENTPEQCGAHFPSSPFLQIQY